VCETWRVSEAGKADGSVQETSRDDWAGDAGEG
jgi:hypothetical protein